MLKAGQKPLSSKNANTAMSATTASTSEAREAVSDWWLENLEQLGQLY
jgi:hypothetical protein